MPTDPNAAAEPPRRIHLGLSTCPNDTYLAHGLLTRAVATPGLEFEIELLDVQELNERLRAGDFDVAKASYHLALTMADELTALSVGSALGFGNGPLLLAREGLGPSAVPGPDSRVLAPGADTTATLLYRMFHPDGAEPEQVVFHEIMPALERGEADFGVCIHEGRFTYESCGLTLVEDLGASWEGATNAPLPLGGLFARKGLPAALLDRIASALRLSLHHADDHPLEAMASMRPHAQEMDDEVIQAHVDLYVNGWTRRLGPQGERAIAELARRAAEVGAGAGAPPIPEGTRLEVFEPYATRRLFHAVPERLEGALKAAREPSATFSPPSLAAEGFIHLSFECQLRRTLEVHFAGEERVLLLELDPRAVREDVRFEPSRGGELFPHLYRPLVPAKDVIERYPCVRGEGGALEFPTSLRRTFA